MCRSIKTLRGVEPPPTDGDVYAASLQFVRKISGYRKPSTANSDVFEAAVEDIARVSRRLLDGLTIGRSAAQVSAAESGPIERTIVPGSRLGLY